MVELQKITHQSTKDGGRSKYWGRQHTTEELVADSRELTHPGGYNDWLQRFYLHDAEMREEMSHGIVGFVTKNTGFCELGTARNAGEQA